MASTLSPPPVAADAAVRPRPWLAAWTLTRREWVRFVRQRNRVLGAVGQPVLFWLLFGAGLGPTFRLGDASGAADTGRAAVSYSEYFFPGTLVLILLFTAIFTTISIIEDRREGFLQSVLVAPIPRWSLVLGKLLGGTLIAVAQGLLFLGLGYLVGPRLGYHLALACLPAIVGLMFALAFGLTGLGFVIAWRMDSTQGFHAVMSLFLLPLWLLSGAFFPARSGILAWVGTFNPLTYGVAGLRRLLYAGAVGQLPLGLPSLAVCWLVTLAFAALMFAACWQIAGRRTTGDLL